MVTYNSYCQKKFACYLELGRLGLASLDGTDSNAHAAQPLMGELGPAG